MKISNKLVALSTILAVSLLACRKKEGDAPIEQKYSRQLHTVEKIYVVAKLCDLTAEQTLEVIKTFKTKHNPISRNADLVNTDSVAIDSSIFVIEAALNFDYDDEIDTTNVPTVTDTARCQISFNSGSGKVKSSDLQNAYDNIKTQINSSANSSRQILLVDMDGYINTTLGTITYEAKIERVFGTAYGCGTNISFPGSPDLVKFNSWGCSPTPIANPAHEGSILVTSHLPCVYIDRTICQDYYSSYYTNIYNPNQQPYFSSFLDIPDWCPGPSSNPAALPSASYLFSSTPILPIQWCTSVWKYLSPNQLNGYLSNIPTQFAAYIPTTPANMMFIRGWVQKDNDNIYGSPYIAFWWNLRAYYGVKKCRMTPRD